MSYSLKEKDDGWTYTVGHGAGAVSGWHRDRDTAKRLAEGYLKRIGRVAPPEKFSIRPARSRGMAFYD